MYNHFSVYPGVVYHLPVAPFVYPPAAIYPVLAQPYASHIHSRDGFGTRNQRADPNPESLQPRQQYPEVDPTIFRQSAELFKTLMDDGRTLLTKLSESESFAGEVMEAAQEGDKEKVQQLVESTGIQRKATTRFNPDSFTVTLYSDDGGIHCRLSMGLQWN